jgi:hypothetical protein
MAGLTKVLSQSIRVARRRAGIHEGQGGQLPSSLGAAILHAGFETIPEKE